MYCNNCNKAKPIFKVVNGSALVNGSLTKRIKRTVLWCKECWEENEKRCERLRSESANQVKKYAESLGIDTSNW